MFRSSIKCTYYKQDCVPSGWRESPALWVHPQAAESCPVWDKQSSWLRCLFCFIPFSEGWIQSSEVQLFSNYAKREKDGFPFCPAYSQLGIMLLPVYLSITDAAAACVEILYAQQIVRMWAKKSFNVYCLRTLLLVIDPMSSRYKSI